MSERGLFELERVGRTAILVPQTSLTSLFELDSQSSDLEKVLEFVGQSGTRNAVFDCRKMEHVDSGGIAFFVRVWKRVSALGGHVAFCNVSAHERMKIERCRLDTLWQIYDSRAEALDKVGT